MAQPNKVNTGQLPLTGVAQQLPSEPGAQGGFAIKANPANAGIAWLGEDATVSATTGFPLAAGEGVVVDILSLNRIFVIGTAADRISYMTVGAP